MTQEKQKDLVNNEKEVFLVGKSIEILTTDDDRLKIMGEELSNDTGREVLKKIFEGVSSVSTIASSLDISIQLVAWHIERLTKIGLIKVKKVERSSKNKGILHYMPIKFALVIVPSEVVKSPVYSDFLKGVLKKTYQKLPAFLIFITGSISLYFLQKILNLNQNVTLSDPEQIRSFSFSHDLIFSLFGGASIAFIVWMVIKLRKKS
jgi:DNA-binding transcriptional ArsR family regulator